jgi:hypothetical protein
VTAFQGQRTAEAFAAFAAANAARAARHAAVGGDMAATCIEVAEDAGFAAAAFACRGPQGAEAAWDAAHAAEEGAQAALLADILGDLSRPPPALLAPGGPAVLGLAHAAYGDRLLASGTLDVARLAQLADALQAAGCTDGNVLAHLRGPGPHALGCHALDAVLGKS